MHDIHGKPLQKDDIVRFPDGRLCKITGWAFCEAEYEQNIAIAEQCELVTKARPHDHTDHGGRTILWGLVPPDET